jgi:serine/threonine protein kinase
MAAEASPFAQTELVPVDDFHLIGVLGEGGNGTVYAARHRGSDVALKVLRQGLALSDRECGRFLDEALRMRRVEHEGLVPLLGSGTLSDGRPYLCMPRLRGETLASRLERGRLPLDQAIAVFDTLAQAVAVLHRAGLIHRDIKPENVFLEAGDQDDAAATPHPVLLDFGIARDVAEAESTTTAAGLTRGTPAYMAPERFFGAIANVRSDVYELAVTLYFMLTGRLPWDNVQNAAARLSPMHPEDAGVSLPRELVTVILRALSTRPEMRPESADSLADLVRRAAAPAAPRSARTTAAMAASKAAPGEDASADRAGSTTAPLTNVATQHARHRTRFSLAIGALAVLVVAGAAGLVHSRREAPPAATEPPLPISVLSEQLAAMPLVTEVSPPPEPVAAAAPLPSPAPPPAYRRPASPALAATPTKPATPIPSATPLSPSSSAQSPERYYRDRK